jgi:hypothetical protein
MCWGFDHDDGWFEIIWQLSLAIEEELSYSWVKERWFLFKKKFFSPLEWFPLFDFTAADCQEETGRLRHNRRSLSLGRGREGATRFFGQDGHGDFSGA